MIMNAFLLASTDVAIQDKPVVPMIVLGAIMTGTYLVIAFEWLHKSLAAMLGAIAAVVSSMVFHVFREGGGHTAYYRAVHEIIGEEAGVIGVIVGTSVLVDIASRSGLFHFLAIKMVKKTQGDPLRLHLFLGLATVLFVTFLTITPGTLIMVSLTLVVTKELDLDPKPYIMTVAICANSGALVTFASGMCTLMLGTAGELAYLDFFRVSTPMAFLSVAVALWLLRRFYAASLAPAGDPLERAQKVAGFDEWALVKDRRLFYRSGLILGGTILGFALAQRMGVGIDFIAFCGGTAALLFSGIHPEEAIKKVNWSVVLFFIGLFVIIGAVKESGLLDWQARQMIAWSGVGEKKASEDAGQKAESKTPPEKAAETTGSSPEKVFPPILLILMVAAFVLVLSGLVDNIPVAATLIPIVKSMEAQGIQVEPLWWALVMSANLGGNSTPVGSISSVVALHALEKERHIKVSWGEFLKIGGLITLVQSILVLAYLFVFAYFRLFPGTSGGG